MLARSVVFLPRFLGALPWALAPFGALALSGTRPMWTPHSSTKTSLRGASRSTRRRQALRACSSLSVAASVFACRFGRADGSPGSSSRPRPWRPAPAPTVRSAPPASPRDASLAAPTRSASALRCRWLACAPARACKLSRRSPYGAWRSDRWSPATPQKGARSLLAAFPGPLPSAPSASSPSSSRSWLQRLIYSVVLQTAVVYYFGVIWAPLPAYERVGARREGNRRDRSGRRSPSCCKRHRRASEAQERPPAEAPGGRTGSGEPLQRLYTPIAE